MKLFSNHNDRDVPSPLEMTQHKKNLFGMPRWIIVCTAVVLFIVIGVIAVNKSYISPPNVVPDQDMVTVAPTGSTQSPTTPTAENLSRTPPGNWKSIGRRENVYTVLIVGTDGTSNTDTIMVAALDTLNQKLSVLSIPRDTQVNVKRNIKRINAAWAYGGIDQLRTELKTLIGFVPDVYALVELNGFVALVDSIGGIDINVPMNMNFDDPDQGLHIHLSKGPQHLDGAGTIQLFRYRQSNLINGKRYGYKLGDVERVAFHHEVLIEVFRQTLQMGNLFKIGEFAAIAEQNLESDMNMGQMLWFGEQLMKLAEEDIEFNILPVDIGALYRKADYALVRTEEAVELINATINPYLEPRTSEDLDIIRLWDKWR